MTLITWPESLHLIASATLQVTSISCNASCTFLKTISPFLMCGSSLSLGFFSGFLGSLILALLMILFWNAKLSKFLYPVGVSIVFVYQLGMPLQGWPRLNGLHIFLQRGLSRDEEAVEDPRYRDTMIRSWHVQKDGSELRTTGWHPIWVLWNARLPGLHVPACALPKCVSRSPWQSAILACKSPGIKTMFFQDCSPHCVRGLEAVGPVWRYSGWFSCRQSSRTTSCLLIVGFQVRSTQLTWWCQHLSNQPIAQSSIFPQNLKLRTKTPKPEPEPDPLYPALPTVSDDCIICVFLSLSVTCNQCCCLRPLTLRTATATFRSSCTTKTECEWCKILPPDALSQQYGYHPLA